MPAWTDVCSLEEIQDGRGVVRHVNGAELALMRDVGDVYALDNVCPHRGGQIGDGTVADGTAICPLHGWDFDLSTGISAFNPADRLGVYPARVREDGTVQVDADAVPPQPPRPDVYLGAWTRRGATDRGMHEIHDLADGGAPPVDAMGSERNEPTSARRPYPSYDDLVFQPAQLARLPVLDDVEIDTGVVLGTRAARPLRLEIPIYVSHMSYGALSVEAKEAMACGSAAAGSAICSGEGGMHPRERAAAVRYIFEMASGYFGWTPENIRRADAIEVKVGQGAKPGLGGLLPADKVTAEIAAVRGIEPGAPAQSPARFPDINTPQELAERIAQIKELTGGVPVFVKIVSSHVEADMEAAVRAGADAVTIDGLGGGTGATPVHIRDHVGLPSLFGLYRARRYLEDNGITGVQLVATGGFRTPAEMAKALALGADAVALATASMMAIGCQQYRACHNGTCPVGIATQDERLRARLDIATSARRLERFFTATTEMITEYARACGRARIADLQRDDLATLRADIAERTDLAWVA
jgi:glutamate synthase domain-containing protein 2/nitrite reductase/ring-hydroxylating ferredoxin subunit